MISFTIKYPRKRTLKGDCYEENIKIHPNINYPLDAHIMFRYVF